MEEAHPKTHHECRCRECDPITAMAERMDAWKAATSLVREGPWPDDDKPAFHDVMVLADWLLYGPGDDGD